MLDSRAFGSRVTIDGRLNVGVSDRSASGSWPISSSERYEPLIDTALVRPVERGLLPEPFRFDGVRFVRGAGRARPDRASGRSPMLLPRLLAGLAPSGVTPAEANFRELQRSSRSSVLSEPSSVLSFSP